MKLIRKFYRRQGDGTSSKDWAEKFILSDGSNIYISLSLVLYPKFNSCNKFQWYFSVSNHGWKIKDTANSYRIRNTSKLWKSQIKKIYEIVFFDSGKLIGHNYKNRQKIINSWFNKVLG